MKGKIKFVLSLVLILVTIQAVSQVADVGAKVSVSVNEANVISNSTTVAGY